MAQVIRENEVGFLVDCFSKVPDPRVKGRSRHLLIDVIVTTVCAVLCGARTCTDFEDFSIARLDWLKTFLILPNGIPSHDTYRRVLTIIDPVQLETAFREWVMLIKNEKMAHSKVISLDGKSIGGSPQGGIAGRSFLHVVNVFCHQSSLSLGQMESQGSGGETTAALEMLDLMDIKGTLILADAKFAVNKVASKIREKGGHYLLALKDNNRFYRERVIAEFASASKADKKKTKNVGHSRTEYRECKVISASKSRLDEKFFKQWPNLKTLIQISRSRTFEDKRPFVQLRDEKSGKIKFIRNKNTGGSGRLMRTTSETAYYISSKSLTAEQAQAEVRKHWGIENKLHWVLDVAFAEDDWLARAKQLSRNLASIRKIGLNLIRSNPSLDKKSIRRHMNIAGWSLNALENIVFKA